VPFTPEQLSLLTRPCAALTGIGARNVINIPVDHHARMRIDNLRGELELRLKNQQPVYAVTAVIGTTEEGAVDSLDEVIKLREEFAAKGLSFMVHADAACASDLGASVWRTDTLGAGGGYFASMIRDDPEDPTPRSLPGGREDVFEFSLREHTVEQFRALAKSDAVTIDPHKAGYVPYPA
jgi:glutamate/tyrosine decarboxylase-like PLP-dependent enzyme